MRHRIVYLNCFFQILKKYEKEIFLNNLVFFPFGRKQLIPVKALVLNTKWLSVSTNLEFHDIENRAKQLLLDDRGTGWDLYYRWLHKVPFWFNYWPSSDNFSTLYRQNRRKQQNEQQIASLEFFDLLHWKKAQLEAGLAQFPSRSKEWISDPLTWACKCIDSINVKQNNI